MFTLDCLGGPVSSQGPYKKETGQQRQRSSPGDTALLVLMIEEKLRAKECEEAGKAKEMNLPEPQEGTVPADPWILAQRLILDF